MQIRTVQRGWFGEACACDEGYIALAPVSVLRGYEHRGIGGKLLKAAHEKARELGFKSIILVGHEDYYPRFGYVQANTFGIKFPFDVPAKTHWPLNS